MEWLTDPHAWMALATLTALEIVLGLDNLRVRSRMGSVQLRKRGPRC